MEYLPKYLIYYKRREGTLSIRDLQRRGTILQCFICCPVPRVHEAL